MQSIWEPEKGFWMLRNLTIIDTAQKSVKRNTLRSCQDGRNIKRDKEALKLILPRHNGVFPAELKE